MLEENAKARDIPVVLSLNAPQSCVSVIKAAIGAGSFILPYSISRVGLPFGLPLVLIGGFLSYYTLGLLLKCDVIVNYQRSMQKVMYSQQNNAEFDDTTTLTHHLRRMETSFNTLPELGCHLFPECSYLFRNKKHNLLGDFVSIGIILTAFGVCAAYLDFISSTLPEIIASWAQVDCEMDNTSRYCVSSVSIIGVLCPVLLVLSMLNDYRILAWTSVLGDTAVCVACSTVLIVGFISYFFHSSVVLHSATSDTSFLSINTSQIAFFPKFFGDISFLFGIHIVSFPILQQTAHVNLRPTANIAVARTIYWFLTAFNLCFGVLGCWLYSSTLCPASQLSGPCSNVLNNLNAGGALDAIKLLICVDLLFSFPIVLSAGRIIIEGTGQYSTTVPPIIEHYKCDMDHSNNVISRLHCSEQNATQQRNDARIRSGASLFTLLPVSADETYGLSVEDTAMDITIPNSNGYKSLPMEQAAFNNNTASPMHIDRDPIAVSAVVGSHSTSLVNLPWMYVQVAGNYALRAIHSDSRHFKSYINRAIMVAVVIFIALWVPGFDEAVSLTGGVICSTTGYLLPPLFYFRALRINRELEQNEAVMTILRNCEMNKLQLDDESVSLEPTAIASQDREWEQLLWNFFLRNQQADRTTMSSLFVVVNVSISLFGLFVIVSNCIIYAMS